VNGKTRDPKKRWKIFLWGDESNSSGPIEILKGEGLRKEGKDYGKVVTVEEGGG